MRKLDRRTVNGARKRAASSYKALAGAAFESVKLMTERDILTVARAINPRLKDFEASVKVFRESFAPDGSEPMLSTLATESVVYLYRMEPVLVFFREHWNSYGSGNSGIRNDIRLVLEFPRVSEMSTPVVWLDCETGLPYRPESCQRIRKLLTPEHQQERAAQDIADLAAARKALDEIEAEGKANR